jgi:hypothetical protein
VLSKLFGDGESPMNTRYVIPILTVCCVLLLAWFVLPRDAQTSSTSVTTNDLGSNFVARLAALESDLAIERDARRELQTRYDEVIESLAIGISPVEAPYPSDGGDFTVDDSRLGLTISNIPIEGETIIVPAGNEDDPATTGPVRLTGRQLARARAEAIMGGREREFLAEQLVLNGFSLEEAEHITKRESELRLESLYADYEERRQEAQRSLDAANTQDRENPNASPRVTERLSPNEQLRLELGDENYASFLESSGRSTSVSVRSVMESSPAQMSGLQSGDEILSYNGERVFSISEINERTVEGLEGESVLLEVERNGEEMQIAIPRGPIGISTGRGR